MTIQFDEEKSNQKYDDLMRKEEEDLVQILSAKYGVDYVNLLGAPVNTDALRLIDEPVARAAKAAAYALINKKVKVAVRNPEDVKVKEVMSNLTDKGYEPEVSIASIQSLEKAWKAYKDLSFAYEN